MFLFLPVKLVAIQQITGSAWTVLSLLAILEFG